jgi:hypothetical protein
MHLKSKNAESLVMTHVKVGQSDPWEESNDPSKFVEIALELARGSLLLRNQHEFTRGNQQCASGSKLALESAEDGSPLYRGQ